MVPAVTSFDYMHSSKPAFLRKLSQARLPDRLHAAASAFSAVALLFSGTWAIESYRLREVRRLEQIYRDRYLAGVRAVRQSNVYADRVRAVVDLDRSVREIGLSGYVDARRLAEIANELPHRTWLTSISYEGQDIALEGRAPDLTVLATLISRLSRAPDLGSPALTGATLVPETASGDLLKYTLRLEKQSR